jgi:hypothetical protein
VIIHKRNKLNLATCEEESRIFLESISNNLLCSVVFFNFFHIENLAKFNKKIAELIKFALEKQKIPEFSQFVCQKITKKNVAVGSYWELAERIRNKINDL